MLLGFIVNLCYQHIYPTVWGMTKVITVVQALCVYFLCLLCCFCYDWNGNWRCLTFVFLWVVSFSFSLSTILCPMVFLLLYLLDVCVNSLLFYCCVVRCPRLCSHFWYDNRLVYLSLCFLTSYVMCTLVLLLLVNFGLFLNCCLYCHFVCRHLIWLVEKAEIISSG